MFKTKSLDFEVKYKFSVVKVTMLNLLTFATFLERDGAHYSNNICVTFSIAWRGVVKL